MLFYRNRKIYQSLETLRSFKLFDDMVCIRWIILATDASILEESEIFISVFAESMDS